jgi:REP element-mobilizing transposase RayT
MDRCWLLTWTTYGTWRPGDERGFVSDIRQPDGTTVIANRPGEDYTMGMRGLERFSKEAMSSDTVFLNSAQANCLLDQFLQTATYREWMLWAAAIMRNHVHLVVGVMGDPEPEAMLKDFKSYGSRVLNNRLKASENGRWWTASGSRRKLPDEPAIIAAIRYVESQQGALVIYVDPAWSSVIRE